MSTKTKQVVNVQIVVTCMSVLNDSITDKGI